MSRSTGQQDVSLTRKASDLFKRTVSRVIPAARDRKSSKSGHSRTEDPLGRTINDAGTTDAQSASSKIALLLPRNEATGTSVRRSEDNDTILSVEQFDPVDHEDPWTWPQSSMKQRPALQDLSPNHQHASAHMQAPAANESLQYTPKRSYEGANVEDRESLHDDIFGDETSGSVLRTIPDDGPSSSQTELGTDALAQEFPVAATIEVKQHIMPCSDSSIKANGAMWLLVDLKCVSLFGDNSRAATLCPGILEKLSLEFRLPPGYEIVKHCGALQQKLMTAGTLNNVWSVAICICRERNAESLRSKVTSTVSSTTSMIDGFLRALRADNPSQPQSAVCYIITAHKGNRSTKGMFHVKRYGKIPQFVEKRATSVEQLDEVQKLLPQVREGNDDQEAFTALSNDFLRWNASANASVTTRASSLIPRPLFGSRKARGDKE